VFVVAKLMQQKRLIIALLISTAILFLWSYFNPVKPPVPPPSPQNQTSPQPTPDGRFNGI